MIIWMSDANNLQFSGVERYIKEKFKVKENGSSFTKSDIQGYVRRGKMPKCYGDVKIVSVKDNYSTYNLYNIYNKK